MLALTRADDPGIFGDGTPVSLPFGVSVESTVLLEVAAVVAVAFLWFMLLAAARAWTRPADVDPLPAHADLAGDESPAVVSLLANRWRLNEDAAEATLIDLAARHWIELRQPGNDPTHTTVHVLKPPDRVQPLRSYEQQVLDHVRSAAVNDVVPVTALTFRDLGEAHRWTQRLHGSVIEDARALGLTRRRFSPTLVTLLSLAAGVPAVLLALVIIERSGEVGAGPGAGLIGWGLLSALAGRPLGERDTPAGREAAARWLGLKEFLRNDEAFAELPPAAVTVWDRYLSYGDALGVTRVCSALLDLGMGDRKRVWSSFGGSWHRVRVRYPKFWGRYGATGTATLVRAVLTVVIGGLILKAFAALASDLPDGANDLIGDIPLVVGGYLVVRGGYRIIRMIIDLAAPKTLTGELLWVELWKATQASEDKPAVPIVHYFAVDDGTSDRTTAWAVPSDWSARARPGDLVTIVVRPWTRRVTELTVDVSRAAQLAEAAGLVSAGAVSASAGAGTGTGAGTGAGVAGNTGAPAAASNGHGTGPLGPLGPLLTGPLGVPAAKPGAATGGGQPLLAPVVAAALVTSAAQGPSAPASTELLTAPEVTAALGRPVVTDGASARISLGPFELITFTDQQSRKPVLVLAIARGSAVQMVLRGLRAQRGGTPLQLPGPAGTTDEAWSGPDWVLARRGQAMVRLTREKDSPFPQSSLATLLATALSRL